MIPILGGLGAALLFSVSVLASARASRLIGSPSTVAGAMTIGLVLTLPVALFVSPPPDLGQGNLVWAFLAGAGNVLGLLLIYAAYRLGAVGVSSAIASTEGAIAAVIAVLAGEALAPGSGVLLAVVVVGVVLAASAGGEEEGVAIPRDRALRAAGISVLAAISFGVSLYASGRVAEALPLAWAILPARVVGVAAVALPLAILGRVRITRAALPYVAAVGLAEVLGYISFTIGAREGIAIAAVLSSMFAPVAAVAAFVVFRGRLIRRQIVGIATIVVGVAGLGLLQR
jgi:drug/metabolite transporter (DMT)-like permease